MKYAFKLGLVILALTVSACGSGGAEHQQAQAQAKGRPLPKYERAVLPAGEYHTTEFEPSLSFRITGDDWRFEGPSGTLGDPEHPDYLFFEKVPEAEIAFFNLRKLKGVYKPGGPKGEIEPVPAPDELVGWFQHHPYLQTSKPKPVTVGGVKGEQFDVVVEVPEGYYGACGTDCMDIYSLSGGEPVGFEDGVKTRIIVYEDVKDETVANDIGVSEPSEFDSFMPEAKKVLDTVKWSS